MPCVAGTSDQRTGALDGCGGASAIGTMSCTVKDEPAGICMGLSGPIIKLSSSHWVIFCPLAHAGSATRMMKMPVRISFPCDRGIILQGMVLLPPPTPLLWQKTHRD